MSVSSPPSNYTPTAADSGSPLLTNGSTSGCTVLEKVHSHVFFQEINLVEKIFMFICVGATAAILADFVGNFVYMLRRYKTSRIVKLNSMQIVGIYPTVAVSTLFALFIPQADLLCELLTTVYMARTMFNFVSLMTLYFGGGEKQLEVLKDDKIVLQAPPCCCCCPCLPKLTTTKKNLFVLKLLVLQGAVVQPLASLAAIVMWLDSKYSPGLISHDNAFPYVTLFTATSLIISLYAYFLLFRLCREKLDPVKIRGKFFALQLVLIFTRIQGIIFTILAANHIPECRGILSTQILNKTYFQMIVILQMFLLSKWAVRLYRTPHENIDTLFTPAQDDVEILGDDKKPNGQVMLTEAIVKQPEKQPLSSLADFDDSRESRI